MPSPDPIVRKQSIGISVDLKINKFSNRLYPGSNIFLAILTGCHYDARQRNKYKNGRIFSGRTCIMAKVFRPSSRESSILSKIESSKEFARRHSINSLRDCSAPLANAIATKLIEKHLIETTNKNSLEEQINHCLDKMTRAEDFDVDYQVAPLRNLVKQPNIISLYVTSFVIEKLINHKDTVDIFGSDEEIYSTINNQVKIFIPG